MKNQKRQNSNTVSAIFVLILGGLTTSCLLLLKHFNIFNIDFEVVFAPLAVTTLLAYGDKLFFYLLANLLNLAASPQKK